MLDRYDENLILGYIENDLDAADRARFEAMLAEDEPLRLLLEQLIADRALLRAVPAKAAPMVLMEQVQSQLERQMPADVAPQRVTGPVSPVIHRFPNRLRWAGGLAAAVALAAGLTWHFDPWGWSTTAQPIGELAHHVTPPDADRIESFDKHHHHRPALPPDGSVADAMPGKSAQAAGPVEQQSKSNREAGAGAGAVATEAGAVAAADMPPGGKATAALTLAHDAAVAPPSAPLPAAADNIKERTTAGDFSAPAPAAAPAPVPDFQIELQTASVSQTRQLLLAWADQNDAVEAAPAGARRGRAMQLGEVARGQTAQAEKLQNDRSREEELRKSKTAGEAAPAIGADGAAGRSAPIPPPVPPAPPAPPALHHPLRRPPGAGHRLRRQSRTKL